MKLRSGKVFEKQVEKQVERKPEDKVQEDPFLQKLLYLLQTQPTYTTILLLNTNIVEYLRSNNLSESSKKQLSQVVREMCRIIDLKFKKMKPMLTSSIIEEATKMNDGEWLISSM